jgi:hypothetical protein
VLLRSKTSSCDRFGELSAVALIGRLSADENRELEAHLKLCSACREEHADFADILHNLLPLAHTDVSSIRLTPPVSITRSAYREGSNYVEGFRDVESVVHASRSADLNERSRRLGKPIPLYAYAAVFVLFLVMGLSAFFGYEHFRGDRARAAKATKLESELDLLRTQAEQRSREGLEKRPSQDSNPQSTKAGQHANDRDTNAEYGKFLAGNLVLQEQLKTATAKIQTLKTDAELSRNRESELLARLSETEQNLAKMSGELEKVQGLRSQDAGTIRAQEDRLKEMEDKLATASVSTERDKRLLAADRDIRDLMGARKLRIVDIFDADSKGRTRKPFGRVFFTEGKSLIFYAFDLGSERPSTQTASYQAWGSEGSPQKGVRSLGIFYQDDQKSNRWILTFDDPVVLDEIDSVFVTIEPPGGSNKPTGSMLLSAYLKASLNHP